MVAPAGGLSTQCYRHPHREALVRCTRCDRPICPECMREAPVGFHCPDDAALGRAPTPRTSVGARLRELPPYVTIALIALNVVVYLYTGTQAAGGIDHPVLAPLFLDWQLQPDVIVHQGEYYRLFTAAFLHVSLLHIGANMLALGVIGVPLERLLGRWRTLAVYFIGILGGSATIFAFGSPDQPVAGASGAIFGLFAASLVLVRRLGLDLQWLIAVIALNFVFTFSVHDISRLGHVGGFLAGGLAALMIAGRPRNRSRVSTRTQMLGLSAIVVVPALMIALRAVTAGPNF